MEPASCEVLVVAAVLGGVLIGVLGGVLMGLTAVLHGMLLFTAVWYVFSVDSAGHLGVESLIIGVFTWFYDTITGKSEHANQRLLSAWKVLQRRSGHCEGLGNMVLGLLIALGAGIAGVVGGFIMGALHWFEHLADVLVGHSIIPDLVNAILRWFTLLPFMCSVCLLRSFSRPLPFSKLLHTNKRNSVTSR